MDKWESNAGGQEPMAPEEVEICRYLASVPDQWVSEIEISRRACGKSRFQEDSRWALGPIARLLEKAMVQANERGHYRLSPGKSQAGSPEMAKSKEPPKPSEPRWPRPMTTAIKKILFVDDDQAWRDLVSLYLQDFGYVVQTVEDGTGALLGLEKGGLDAVILDLDLAEENGLLLLGFLAMNYPEVPIILYTAGEYGADAIAQMLKQGARQYLRKGPLEQLRDALVKACSQPIPGGIRAW